MASGGGPFESGASFGPYTVLGRLDAGGMGEVYRARDTNLQRDVAVKVLRSEFSAHPERLARFRREARILAALNHPHVASIYGFEEPGGSPALIMELVDGPTLADRLLSDPLPVEEALGIALQIAEALEYAHEQGIVHRDLKPANIKVASGGSVKVLDFGLAKALELDATAAQPLDSPTVTMTMTTQAGVVMGTAAYMAPKQAKGHPVDRRADIWALGCVMYEMLTGTPAFRGETSTETLAAVIREDPDWSRLPSGTPRRLRDLLRRCLTKDVRQRMQSIGDVRITLEEIAAGDRAPDPVHRAPSWKGWIAAAATGAAVVAGIAVLLMLTATPSDLPPQSVTRFTITLPDGERLAGLDRAAIALSPDGRLLAYVASSVASARPRVYARRMDSLESRPVRGTDGASNPFFSPDGQWLGFFADGKLKKVPVAGGDAQILADVVNPVGASWAAGSILVAPYGSPIQRMNDTGGALETLARFQPTEILQSWPEWLPGSQEALFTTDFVDGRAVVVQGPRPADRHEILRAPAVMPRYVASGHLLYVAGEELMAVPYDLQHHRVQTGAPPTSVIKGVYRGQYSLSRTGALAYVAGHAPPSRMRLVWVGRDGVAEPLPVPPGDYNQPRLSPDGKRIAVDVLQAFGMQVWLYDLAQDTFKPFTLEGVNRHAIWSPDSQRLVYLAQKDGVARLMSQPTNRSGEAEPLTTNDAPDAAGLLKIPSSVSAGGLAIFVKLFPNRNAEIWSTRAVPTSVDSPSAGEPRRITETRTADGGPQLSPDGQWLAYVSDESGGGREVYVRAFPGPGGPWQVSVGGGNEPQWNPRGGELFYRNGNRMMAVPIDNKEGFSAGKPHELFRGDYDLGHGGYARANYDLSPDGQRFLMLQPVDTGDTPPSQITVALNWSEELKRLAPVRPN